MSRRAGPRAHDEFKRATRALWWQMTCCAALLHFLVFWINPDLRVSLLRGARWAHPAAARPVRAIEYLSADVPASPQLDSRPQIPRQAEVHLAEDFTIAETTFETNPVEAMAAPPMQVVQAPPAFVPSYMGPELLNVDQVLHRLRTGYNVLAKTAEAEGRVTLAFLVSKTGVVTDYRILESSGNLWLDQVALSIKDIVWFSPALEYGRKVDVWIRLPISFAAIGGRQTSGP